MGLASAVNSEDDADISYPHSVSEHLNSVFEHNLEYFIYLLYLCTVYTVLRLRMELYRRDALTFALNGLHSKVSLYAQNQGQGQEQQTG